MSASCGAMQGDRRQGSAGGPGAAPGPAASWLAEAEVSSAVVVAAWAAC